jgi:hypothetical protein
LREKDLDPPAQVAVELHVGEVEGVNASVALKGSYLVVVNDLASRQGIVRIDLRARQSEDPAGDGVGCDLLEPAGLRINGVLACVCLRSLPASVCIGGTTPPLLVLGALRRWRAAALRYSLAPRFQEKARHEEEFKLVTCAIDRLQPNRAAQYGARFFDGRDGNHVGAVAVGRN